MQKYIPAVPRVPCLLRPAAFFLILCFLLIADPPAGAETQSKILSNDSATMTIMRDPFFTAAGGSHLFHFIVNTISSASPPCRNDAFYPPAQATNLRRASAGGSAFRNGAG